MTASRTLTERFTIASGLSRHRLRRRGLVSPTQSFLVGCVLGALIAWTLVGAPL